MNQRGFWDDDDDSIDARFRGACVVWARARNAYGYGVKRVGGKLFYAHRLSYEEAKGTIPEGFQIDHLCRNRACINADHLEAVTPRENLLRGKTVTARNAAVTHCPRGHEYSDKNTRVHKGKRYCRSCAREKAREHSMGLRLASVGS